MTPGGRFYVFMNKFLQNLISWVSRHSILALFLFLLIFMVIFKLILTAGLPRDLNQGISEPIPSYPTRQPKNIPKITASPLTKPDSNFILFEGENYQKIKFSELNKEMFPLGTSKGIYNEGIIVEKLFSPQDKGSALIVKDNFNTIAFITRKREEMPNFLVGDKIAFYGFYFKSIEQTDLLNMNWIKGVPLNTPWITGVIKIINKVPRPTTTSTPSPTPINYSQFQSMHVEDYAKNPPLYYGKPVKIRSAFIKDFLAKGDRGGDTNRIDVLDGYSQVVVPTEMIYNINDNNLYQKATSLLNKGDYINVYGIGEKSSDATGSLTGSQTFPVLKVLRIDKCDMTADIICETGSIETIFSP